MLSPKRTKWRKPHRETVKEKHFVEIQLLLEITLYKRLNQGGLLHAKLKLVDVL